MRWFDGLAVLCIAAVATFVAAQPFLVAMERPAFDGLLALRHQIYAQQVSRQSAQAVVIGLDRETALRPPFDRLPEALWTPQLAKVMTAMLDSGVAVIAQQQAFTTSADAAVPGYDADYLAVLGVAAESGQVVLGRRAPGPDRLSPFPGHLVPLGGYRHVRRAELQPDPDGVVRRVALYEERLASNGAAGLEPSLVLELAARVLGERPAMVAGQDVVLGGYAVPGSPSNAMILNPQGGDGAVPVYSLADLYACAEEGDQEFFRQHFEGKVVVIGNLEPASARHLTSARFLDVTDRDRRASRCRLSPMRSLDVLPVSSGTPDAVITALAVNNLLQSRAVNNLVAPFGIVIAGLLALAAAIAGLRIRFLLTMPACLAFFAGWIYLAAMVLAREAWLMPLAQPLAAVLVSFLLAWGYCFAHRRRRQGTA
ncbi:CHASE2 domain-containing protein [Pelagibius litoralis]|uniref:CHASE2 domain-containing protein n=1 Tax=Pelagibius litoralis TaxID=374515 RepID=A0A967EXF3_9PROT|nr:CHASE2 domain-containing protein [Pelagibius litoralis]NIA69188.1 CHASE2 domain-containing protein [Pelagibius litoralis]